MTAYAYLLRAQRLAAEHNPPTARARLLLLTRALPPLAAYVVRGGLTELDDTDIDIMVAVFGDLHDWVRSAEQHSSTEVTQ